MDSTSGLLPAKASRRGLEDPASPAHSPDISPNIKIMKSFNFLCCRGAFHTSASRYILHVPLEWFHHSFCSSRIRFLLMHWMNFPNGLVIFGRTPKRAPLFMLKKVSLGEISNSHSLLQNQRQDSRGVGTELDRRISSCEADVPGRLPLGKRLCCLDTCLGNTV